MNNSSIIKPEGTDGKAILGSDKNSSLNILEQNALKDLDMEKMNDLAECLFVLNNRRYGPIPGAYMVMCINSGKEWCVGQLNADRNKPFILFDDKIFTTPQEAQKEAERIKKAKGETDPPRRCT